MKNFAWCVAMTAITVHGMENVDTFLAIPDQEEARAQMSIVAEACFENYPDLSELQRDYARTALIDEAYVDPKSDLLNAVRKRKLTRAHEEQLRASVLDQIEKQVIEKQVDTVDEEIRRKGREEWDDSLDAYHFKCRDQEERAPDYISRLLISVILSLLLNAFLGHNS